MTSTWKVPGLYRSWGTVPCKSFQQQSGNNTCTQLAAQQLENLVTVSRLSSRQATYWLHQSSCLKRRMWCMSTAVTYSFRTADVWHHFKDGKFHLAQHRFAVNETTTSELPYSNNAVGYGHLDFLLASRFDKVQSIELLGLNLRGVTDTGTCAGSKLVLKQQFKNSFIHQHKTLKINLVDEILESTKDGCSPQAWKISKCTSVTMRRFTSTYLAQKQGSTQSLKWRTFQLK